MLNANQPPRCDKPWHDPSLSQQMWEPIEEYDIVVMENIGTSLAFSAFHR